MFDLASSHANATGVPPSSFVDTQYRTESGRQESEAGSTVADFTINDPARLPARRTDMM